MIALRRQAWHCNASAAAQCLRRRLSDALRRGERLAATQARRATEMATCVGRLAEVEAAAVVRRAGPGEVHAALTIFRLWVPEF